MNSLLSDLVLEGNPLALEKNYKSVVRGFVLSLKKLDASMAVAKIAIVIIKEYIYLL